MLDKYLMDKMYEVAGKEGIDLNDPSSQQKFTQRLEQIRLLITNVIDQQTKHCGCGNKGEK